MKIATGTRTIRCLRGGASKPILPLMSKATKPRNVIHPGWPFAFPVALVLLLVVPPLPAAVLEVAPSLAPFATIAAAVQAARPGDVVRVHPGTYQGDLVLKTTLALEGLGYPRITGSGHGSVITILAPGCSIRGFQIEHSGGDLQAEDSGVLVKSDKNTVENNRLHDVLYGIYLYGSRNNTIRRNEIRGRRELEIGERGAGLHLWDSPGNDIEDNVIAEARDGLYIQSSPGNTIRRNRVLDLRYGVHYMFSDSNHFEDNIFEHNIAGAAIMYSNDIEFRRNAFVHNRGFSSFGILFQECQRCIAENNFIVDNGAGIFMEALRKSTFRSNVIAENDVGLQVFASAEGNLFCGNNFVQNLSALQLIGRRSGTRWSENGRGNFWSDYRGYDLNGDGVG